MRRHRFHLVTLLLALALVAMAAGCGGDGDEEGSTGGEATGTAEGSGGASGSISIMGVWTGPEQKNFQAVLDGFTEAEPGRGRQVHVGRRPAADAALDGCRGR